MTPTLTGRQGEILRCIGDFTTSRGYPPTAREVSDACQLGGPSGAHRMLETLRHKGFLERAEGSSRSLVLKTPRLDCTSLDTGDLFRLVTVSELHRIFADLNLRMALASDSARTRTYLINEALIRTTRTNVLVESFSQVGLRGVDVKDHLRPLESALARASGDAWEDFIVDQWTFNSVMASLSSSVAAADLRLHAVLWPDIRIGQAATAAAGSWIRDFLTAHPARARDCAQRAKVVAIGTAEMLMSLDAAYGWGEFSVKFDPSQVEEYAPLCA